MLRIHFTLAACAAFAIAALCAPSAALAQHDHEGDVEFSYESGKIAVEFGDEGQVFEGDFGDAVGGPHSTNAPGFDGHELTPDDIIGAKVLGPLMYHNGVGFESTSAIVQVAGLLGTTVPVGSSSWAGTALIGQVLDDGTLHSHINISINSDAPVGAYGVLMSLTALDENRNPLPGMEDSDPFYLVLNRGLDDEAFEGAVGAFAAQVPEPTSLALIGIGLAAWAVRRKRAA